MIYHVARDGESLGEFPEDAFRLHRASGYFASSDHFWTDGMADWKPVRDWLAPMPAPRAASPTPAADPKARVCLHCGFVGRPATITGGNIGTEIVLWLFFLLPGVIYSIWRLSSRHQACPKCEARNMVPVDSPAALRLAR